MQIVPEKYISASSWAHAGCQAGKSEAGGGEEAGSGMGRETKGGETRETKR
jgi:hypothetical protein